MSFKKIYDALHGFIHLNDLEQEIVDSEPFQRLRHLHQLGITFLVYPGATHTRFEHSLGAMHLVTRIYDRLFAHGEQSFDVPYWRQIVRCAALCHDLGHLPFSHDAEEKILGKKGHEAWTLRMIQCEELLPIWETLAARFPDHSPREDVQKVAVGKCHFPGITPSEALFSEILCGDFFGGDRIDYLLRDAKCTGVAHGLFDFDQLMEMLCVLDKEQTVLGIEEDGMASCEALLLARYFMHQRVYQYSSVKAYRFHLKRYMERLYEGKDYLKSIENYLTMTDMEVFSSLRQAARDPNAPGHFDACCIFDRKQRFHAIPWGRNVRESDLGALRKELGIPSEHMGWHLASQKGAALGMDIAVRSRTGKIAMAHQFSRVHIPIEQLNWVYITPECAPLLYQRMQRVFIG